MMFSESKNKTFLIIVSLFGLVVGSGAYYFLHPEPIAKSDEVHVHSDILVYIDDNRLRFTDIKYQSASNQILHPDFHFHDQMDDIIHRHSDNLTLTDFFQSLGFTLNNDCLITDTGTSYCSNDTEKLQLYINGNQVTDIVNYVNQEEDQILIYYGQPNNPNLQNYLSQISDLSCIYSGTCLERGSPPPESCGLTCEI